MKYLGYLLVAAGFYYFFWFLTRGAAGAIIGATILFCAASIVLWLLPDKKPEKVWFRNKWFGWGWTPVTGQGWVVTAFSALLIILNTKVIDASVHSVSDFFISAIPILALIIATLLAICYKTGEKPEWRFGRRNHGTRQS